jgi:carbamoyl-phosphate synthase large subunit
MPKRTDIKSILIIGAGPIVIGQACEFDYSGAQACKALKEEGYRVILVNSNPATIMTDPNLADATYIEPIKPAMVAKIIEKERPDAILPTMGGQTALNTALALFNDGTLEKYGVEMIGAKKHVIEKAEDRQLFREAMDKIGLESARSAMVRTFEDAVKALEVTGLPAIIRPSFTLGGEGGGIAYNREEFEQIVRNGLAISPTHEVLIEESILGWKEYEMEVVRDNADNCIIICSIENVDPMGIHTGDSITVAPALTLTDKEYQIMRDASLAVLREIGVDTGGSNVQFAVNPDDGRLIVIEMNPRVSRSSALASKATGFPIAKIAAKLAVGYTLDELDNDITGVTPASFEPTIDYVVTKIPRFTFEKFPGAKPLLGTAMKSVGEAMSIGGCFAESLQKGLRSMETGLTGLNEVKIEGAPDKAAIRAKLTQPIPFRILYAAQAFRHGLTLKEIQGATKFDPWYLKQIEMLVAEEEKVRANGIPTDKQELLRLKKLGFSDARLAELTGKDEDAVRADRHALGLRPVYKRIDTCAAEFPSRTSYMYSMYEGDGFVEPENEAEVTDRKKVIILGGGPNRIGQGIEFDYCCVHAALAAREDGYETIMVNCNPETVSTDYDTSDRLYFEPITLEDVLEIAHVEKPKGVIVQYGGQTPLKLAVALEQAGVPIIGTSPEAIDRAEDREQFLQMLKRLGLKQPENATVRSLEEAIIQAKNIGYPLVVRPSYVLGGRAMEIVYKEDELRRYMNNAVQVSNDAPVLLDHFLNAAIEVDIDAVSDGETVVIGAIMQHIEQAGVHSGDSACSLPPYNLAADVQDEMREMVRKMALELGVVGLMNVQLAYQDGEIYVIEVNPRASRTVPFVSKCIGVSLAKIAALVMTGKSLEELGFTEEIVPKFFNVKEAVFPFNKFPGVDPILGPEMKSTGEVMGTGATFGEAFMKAQLGAGERLPRKGTAFISVRDVDKQAVVPVARDLVELGFRLVATSGTAALLDDAGLAVERVNKVAEGRPNIVDMLKNGEIAYVINTTEGRKAIADSAEIRRSALQHKVPYTTTLAGAAATAEALKYGEEKTVRSLQDLHAGVAE